MCQIIVMLATLVRLHMQLSELQECHCQRTCPLVQEPSAKKQKPACTPELTSGRDECQNVETDKVETEASQDEVNVAEITDTSLYWPRNRKLASDSKTADPDSLFPFEKQSS